MTSSECTDSRTCRDHARTWEVIIVIVRAQEESLNDRARSRKIAHRTVDRRFEHSQVRAAVMGRAR